MSPPFPRASIHATFGDFVGLSPALDLFVQEQSKILVVEPGTGSHAKRDLESAEPSQAS
jgi:hypothetical protein